MARTTTKPRLAKLDPTALGDEVQRRLHAHLARLVIPLGMSASVRIHEGTQSDLSMTARALTAYAQTGLPAWDWETHGEAEDACHEMVSILYGRPSEACETETDNVGPLASALADLDLDDPVDLVIVAAWARVTLSKRGSLTTRALAALAGMDPRAVQRLGRDGEIRLSGDPLAATAAEARRWLSGRGVRV